MAKPAKSANRTVPEPAPVVAKRATRPASAPAAPKTEPPPPLVAVVEPEAVEPEAPTSGAGPSTTQRGIALRVLRTVARKLAKYNYEDLGVGNQVSGAVALLRSAQEKLVATRPRTGKEPIEIDAIVRIREKSRDHFAGIIDGGDLDGIRVERVTPRHAVGRTKSGERIAIEFRHLERAS